MLSWLCTRNCSFIKDSAKSPSNDTSSIVAGIGGNDFLLFRYNEDFIEGRVRVFAVAPDVDGLMCISFIVSLYTCGIGVVSVVTLSFSLSTACDTWICWVFGGWLCWLFSLTTSSSSVSVARPGQGNSIHVAIVSSFVQCILKPIETQATCWFSVCFDTSRMLAQ